MNNIRAITSITTGGALALIEAAISSSKRMNVAVSVAVCGPKLNLIAFARSDSATPHSAETSTPQGADSRVTGKATG